VETINLSILFPSPPPSGTHTLRYNVRAHSLEGSEKTQLLVLIYVDEELFLKYNGDSRETEPLGCWIKGHGGNETCARETNNLLKVEEKLRGMMAEVINQKSQEEGKCGEPEVHKSHL
jgi:hypothetical protein